MNLDKLLTNLVLLWMERPTIPFLINIYCLQKLLPIKPYQKPFKSKTLFFSIKGVSMRSQKAHTARAFFHTTSYKKAPVGLCAAKRRILLYPSCMRLLFYLMLLKFCKNFKRNQIEDFKKEVMVVDKAQQILLVLLRRR